MKHTIGSILVGMATFVGAADFEFEDPKILTSEGKPIKLDSPGYASPCWTDLNEDGKAELLVGQFAKGLIAVYEHQGDLTFGARKWLEADGEIAEVPGVW